MNAINRALGNVFKQKRLNGIRCHHILFILVGTSAAIMNLLLKTCARIKGISRT